MQEKDGRFIRHNSPLLADKLLRDDIMFISVTKYILYESQRLKTFYNKLRLPGKHKHLEYCILIKLPYTYDKATAQYLY